ncbi:HEPN domain-containing protein [Bacillus mycoides]|uniref:HEPN domain-containing protein n=1 Tax=Bacillus mycoides TaxID=1405 RepID=UPI00027984B8|nr:HEPN domain-containing protein [Bacillus mycoides]EJR94480.1 hypothetical protein IKM_05530 [Bacillus mycoides]EJR94990.1 hypothetical protein IKO_05891 [Bacillus cereus VDM034]
MKYRFITTLHNMELSNVKNKGTEIFPGARISNGSKSISETLDTNLARHTMGYLTRESIRNTTYVYIDGEFKDIHNFEEMNKVGVQRTFSLLRQIEHFTHELWKVKDNNVYVIDGFLFAYNKHFEDGYIYQASLTGLYSFSTYEQKESTFSDSELTAAIQNFVPLSKEEFNEKNFGGKHPNVDILLKNKGSNRMLRALYFTGGARSSSVMPIKIVNYCNALECLFTTGKSEVNHKIAERVAIMLGTSFESKKALSQLVKKAYNIRSEMVHGQALKAKEEDLVIVSQGLDNVLRELIVANHDVFSKNDKEMDDFFLDLLFS